MLWYCCKSVQLGAVRAVRICIDVSILEWQTRGQERPTLCCVCRREEGGEEGRGGRGAEGKIRRRRRRGEKEKEKKEEEKEDTEGRKGEGE